MENYNMKKTIVVNLFGGPGTGKSILTNEIFSILKRKYISCEISPEYYKKKFREEAKKVTQNQIYIFRKQQFQLFSLNESVSVVVTDSPILFSTIYDEEKCPFLKGLSLKEFNKYNNLNFYIQRDADVPYEQEGRYQDSNGAKLVDERVKVFLDEHKIEYTLLNGIGNVSLDTVVTTVINKLEQG